MDAFFEIAGDCLSGAVKTHFAKATDLLPDFFALEAGPNFFNPDFVLVGLPHFELECSLLMVVEDVFLIRVVVMPVREVAFVYAWAEGAWTARVRACFPYRAALD